MYDSRPSTYEHIKNVSKYLHQVAINLLNRATVHDDSKLVSPELEIFDEFTPKLKDCTYGSIEYEGFLKGMKVALDHHYANNRHHPEFAKNGIKGMSLLDIMEMLVDWKAATLRHTDGNLLKSIEMNQKRFGYTDELKMILINTVKELGL